MANIVRRRNLVTGRKYTTTQGEEKTRWTTVGKIFQDDQGREYIKLDVVPLGWDGFASIFEEQQPQQQYRQPQQAQPGQTYGQQGYGGAGYVGANYAGQTPQPQQQPMHAGASASWGGGYQPQQPAPTQPTAPPVMPPEDDLPF